jgi:hypothetical protein
MCDFMLKFGAKAGSAVVKPPNLDPKIRFDNRQGYVTLRVMTLSMTTFSIALIKCDTQQIVGMPYVIYVECDLCRLLQICPSC